MDDAPDVERDAAVVTVLLERREFLLVDGAEPKEPHLAGSGGRLLQEDVLVAKRTEKPVDFVGPLDFVEVGVDLTIEVSDLRDGGVVANALFEFPLIAVVFFPEIGDELVVDGDELSEFDSGGGVGEGLPENEVVGVDGDTGDDAHRRDLGKCGDGAIVWLYSGLSSAAGESDMVVSVGSTVPHSVKQVTTRINPRGTDDGAIRPQMGVLPDRGECSCWM